jgi:hypothetical protein
MNRDDIYRMAKEAGFMTLFINEDTWIPYLEKFAKLVAEAERERIKWDTIHSCHPECDKPVCVAIRKAVEAEREACAKVAEEWQLGIDDPKYQTDCAFAIRERGAP